MVKSLTWQKKFFSSCYNFFSNGITVGFLKENVWGQSSEGVIDGKHYTIKSKGFFGQKATVINTETGMPEASITFNSWKTKAEIIVGSSIYSWQYNNVWNSTWNMVGWNGEQLHFSSSGQQGMAQSNSDDSLLLLLGIYTHNAFRVKATTTVLIALIPIWISILN